MTKPESDVEHLLPTIFGSIFLLERRWSRIGDHQLAGTGMTTKQWAMLATIGRSFEHAPSLQEVALSLNTSHQNAKAIASKLQQQGFVVMERDAADRRVLRLKLTAKNEQFWQQRQSQDEAFIKDLLGDLSPREISQLAKLLTKVVVRADTLNDAIQAAKTGAVRGTGTQKGEK